MKTDIIAKREKAYTSLMASVDMKIIFTVAVMLLNSPLIKPTISPSLNAVEGFRSPIINPDSVGILAKTTSVATNVAMLISLKSVGKFI